MNKQRINKFLNKWNVELHGTNYIYSLRKKAKQIDEFDYFKEKINKKNPVVFDLGANRGLFIENSLKVFKEPIIYAFEPAPESYIFLKEKYKNNENIKIFDFGISDKEGVTIFYINKGMDTSSLLPPVKTGLNSDSRVKIQSKVSIKTTTIDVFSDKNAIPYIDLFKLDIQGSELSALFGACELLRQKKIGMIYLETYFIQQYENQPLFFEIATFLIKNGYVLQDIYGPIYGNGRLAWCDSLFILK